MYPFTRLIRTCFLELENFLQIYVHASNDTQADLYQKTQDDLRQPLRYGWSA